MLLLLLINYYRQSRQYLPTILVVSDRKADDPLLQKIILDSQTKGFLGDLQIEHITVADFEKNQSWPQTIIDQVLRRRVVAIACLNKTPFSQLRAISSNLGIPLVNLADPCIDTIDKSNSNEFHLVTRDSRQLGAITNQIVDLLDSHKKGKVKVHIIRSKKGIRDAAPEKNESDDFLHLKAVLDKFDKDSWTQEEASQSFVSQLKNIEKNDRNTFHILVILEKGDFLSQIIESTNCINLNKWNIVTTDHECESLRNVVAKHNTSWENKILKVTYISLLRAQSDSIKKMPFSEKSSFKYNSMWSQYYFFLNLVSRLPKENFRSESFRHCFSSLLDNNGKPIFKIIGEGAVDSTDKKTLPQTSDEIGHIVVDNTIKYQCLNNPM